MATRSTIKKAEEARISQVGDFKKRLGGIIELPSGLHVRWKNPGGLRAFLANGTIPNSLLPIVEKSLKKKQDVNEAEMLDLIKDADKVSEMMAMYDSVVMQCIKEPKLWPVPTEEDVEKNNLEHPDAPVDDPEDLRYDDRLYVDELPDDDKMYIFQLVSGGVKDLETFRQKQQINVGALARVSGVEGYAIESAGTDEG